MKKITPRAIGYVALAVALLLFSRSFIGCKESLTENDKLSYATGFVIARKHMKLDYGIFWFHKDGVPDITACNFDVIASSLHNAFEGHPQMTFREANLKMHDFFDDRREERTVNKDSLAIVYGVLFHWTKFRKELLQFDPNVDLLIRGVYDGITSTSDPLVDEKTAVNLFKDYYSVRLPELNMAKTKKYLAEIEASTPGIQHTPSGLLYRIDNPGDNQRITNANDVCQANYTEISQLGGLVSSLPTRQFEVHQPLNTRSSLFQEALTLIGVGGKVTVWANTSDLGGDIFYDNTTPNLPVICEFELISFRPSSTDVK